ncbi:MAG: DNA mismatch repair protein MutS [Elusimicrobiota bacterium]
MDPKPQKPDTKKDALTPLMQQYRDIKTQYPGVILFFRLGDFYEMFGEDAIKASPALEVVLTKRQDVPMCGVPYHAVNSYIRKLISKGEKVAVCEQLEEPRPGIKVVRRGVVRVITPGTILEDNLLEAKQNNFLTAILPSENLNEFGLAYVDISTGEFGATQTSRDNIKNELYRLSSGELILPKSREKEAFIASFGGANVTLSALDDWFFEFSEAATKLKRYFNVQSLKPLGIENKALAAGAAGAILAYLEKTQVTNLPPLSKIRYYSLDEYMLLDETAIKNLELTASFSSGSKENSLLGTIDSTLTPMGARSLRQWLTKPLISAKKIVLRQQAVSFFADDGMARRQVRALLKGISDIERILSRLASGAASPKEVIALKNSLEILEKITENLKPSDSFDGLSLTVSELTSKLKVPSETIELISGTLADEPPVSIKEGGVIRDGFNPELDELRRISRDAKKFISETETGERERTGINSLKIGYTSVFGYYIEVTKPNLRLVPQEYIRKQTVANGERFITPELKSLEEKILSADERIIRLEETLFRELRSKLLESSGRLQEIASALAELDVYSSLAETAALNNYVKPHVDESHEMDIKEGRHPVIEKMMRSGAFVPNDTYLNPDTDQIIILTGPNMAGKSTYLRQAALITILAQIGSYVPASSAVIGIVDRIFTRIGAADNLAGGESTFMVEMHETSSILNQFTPRSLIILDEVGRGTSTYDGISIARASVEYLAGAHNSKSKGPKVLFATHYFELTDLPDKYGNIKNFNVSVKEWQGNVVFLHKIIPGSADRSYGIHVAQLAGLPDTVVSRAKTILHILEQKYKSEANGRHQGELELFAQSAQRNNIIISQKDTSNFNNILVELGKIDLNDTTPIEALKILTELKTKITQIK